MFWGAKEDASLFPPVSEETRVSNLSNMATAPEFGLQTRIPWTQMLRESVSVGQQNTQLYYGIQGRWVLSGSVSY